MLPKMLSHHGFCYHKLTSLNAPSFLSLFSFLSPHDSPSPNIVVIYINMYD